MEDRLSEAGRSGRVFALTALAFLLCVTAAWWALALWPASEAAPAWLGRARAVCFNAPPGGLPDASGWILLVGQPLGMLAVLMAGWGTAVREGLRSLSGQPAGRAVLIAACGLLVAGAWAAAARVAGAPDASLVSLAGSELPPETYPRLDREAPEIGLVDQHGLILDVAGLRGRPALVTFAFGHCETVCPLVIRDARDVQERARARDPEKAPRLVIVTLDPWRDTPSRLPYLAEHWKLGVDAHVVSGEVDEVNAVLDAWQIPRERDERDGSLAHPPVVFVLDAEGRIAFGAAGGAETLATLLGRV